MNKTFIFDYDDTLAWCENHYCYAALDFMRFVLDRLKHKAPDVETNLKIQSGLNHAGVLEKGFAMKVFPSSFRDAYRKICAEKGIEDEEGAETAYRIGMSVFDEGRYRKDPGFAGNELLLVF